MNETRIPFPRLPAVLRRGDTVLFSAPPELLTPRVTQQQRDEQYEQLLGGLQLAIDDLQHQQRQSLTELQQVAIELATTAAAWLTFAAIDRHQFAIDRLVSEAVAELGGNTPPRIRMNPEDHRLLISLQRSGSAQVGLSGVTVIDDAALSRGSCLAENDSVSIVSDLESRLAGVRQAWLESLNDAQTERRTTDTGRREIGRVPDRRETA